LRSSLWLLCAVSGRASPPPGAPPNSAAWLAYPGVYHSRPIVIVGKVALEKDELRVSDDSGSVRLVFKGKRLPTAWTKFAASSGTSAA
jgi:hypothetical protein